MISHATFIDQIGIARRVREVRESWNYVQRAERANEGSRHLTRLAHLMASKPSEPEIGATGALDEADLHRLAG